MKHPNILFLGIPRLLIPLMNQNLSKLGFNGVYISTRQQLDQVPPPIPPLEEIRFVFASSETLGWAPPVLTLPWVGVGNRKELFDVVKALRCMAPLSIIESFSNHEKIQATLKTLRLDFDPSYHKDPLRKGAQDVLDKEVATKDSDFVAIRLSQFSSGHQCLFDVYIRLREGHYLKILAAGGPFEPERITRYASKGIQDLFLRKEDHESYLKYCAVLSTRLVNSEGLSLKTQVNQTLGFGSEAINFLKGQKVPAEKMDFTEKFVTNVQSLVKKMGEQHRSLDPFLNDLKMYDHGVSTAVISVLMAHEMGIQSDRLLQLVGLAAAIHDVGLSKIPEPLRVDDYRSLSPEDQQKFLEHGDLGASLVQQIPGLHSSVLQAVEYHHHRKFNPHLNDRVRVKSDLNWVTEIIGFADEVMRLIPKTQDGSSVAKQVEEHIEGVFSPDILNAAKKTMPGLFSPAQ